MLKWISLKATYQQITYFKAALHIEIRTIVITIQHHAKRKLLIVTHCRRTNFNSTALIATKLLSQMCECYCFYTLYVYFVPMYANIFLLFVYCSFQLSSVCTLMIRFDAFSLRVVSLGIFLNIQSTFLSYK